MTVDTCGWCLDEPTAGTMIYGCEDLHVSVLRACKDCLAYWRDTGVLCLQCEKRCDWILALDSGEVCESWK